MLQIKGVALLSTMAFLRNRAGVRADEYIEAARGTSLAQLSAVQPQGWYDISFYNTLMDAHTRCAAEKGQDVTQRYVEVGAYIAEDNLNTVYKLMLKLTSPVRLLSFLPRMWGQYFHGIETEVSATGSHSGTCLVHGMGTAPHTSPTARGWLTLAYQKVGSPNPTVEEKNYSQLNPAPEHLSFTIRW